MNDERQTRVRQYADGKRIYVTSYRGFVGNYEPAIPKATLSAKLWAWLKSKVRRA